MAKPKRATVMFLWMLENGWNDIELAHELNSRLPENRSISARQVFRWKRGHSFPRPIYLRELEKISAGRLNGKTFADDFREKEPE